MADDTAKLQKIVQSGVPLRKGIAMGMAGEAGGATKSQTEKPARKGK